MMRVLHKGGGIPAEILLMKEKSKNWQIRYW